MRGIPRASFLTHLGGGRYIGLANSPDFGIETPHWFWTENYSYVYPHAVEQTERSHCRQAQRIESEFAERQSFGGAGSEDWGDPCFHSLLAVDRSRAQP